MPALSLGGLFAKLRPPADAGSDAALLDRFVKGHDPDAFADIVRRHGAMVLAVCRRVLGDGPDAEDAHQIAFMALARDAGRISDPNALGGWLYRVAWLSARKLAGRAYRRKPEPLTTDPATPMVPAPEADVRAVIDDELLALPERFRAVAVLCLLEGRTNTEAAGLLGIPKGTVDSRLSTAKAKLRERLVRRGVAAAALLTAEHLLTSETSAAATRAATLAATAVGAALDYAAGTPAAGTEHLIHTANGVRPVTSNLKWLAVVLFASAVVGGGGVGVYVASAADKDKPADAKKPADDKKPPADAPKADKPGELTAEKGTTAKTADDVQKALGAKVDVDGPLAGLEFGLFIDDLSKKTGVPVRIDTAAFVRRGWEADEILALAKHKLFGEAKPPERLDDLLRETLAQVGRRAADGLDGHQLSYRIKGREILIVPEYVPSLPADPNGRDIPTHFVRPRDLLEYQYGEPVTVRYKNKPLAEVIEDLQDRTGANIVLNGKALPDVDKAVVTANFNDARLLTVLKVVGDMHGLKPVVIDNVFYLTDAARAEDLQKEVNRDLFGTPPAPPVKK